MRNSKHLCHNCWIGVSDNAKTRIRKQALDHIVNVVQLHNSINDAKRIWCNTYKDHAHGPANKPL
jgi:hypothetical protein